MAMDDREGDAGGRTPLLEWIAAGIGLILATGMFGLLAKEALSGESEAPPVIEVVARKVTPVSTGFVLEFEARNRSTAPAAAVVIEGSDVGGSTSTVTIDYVPAKGTATGGLFFKGDPASGAKDLRAVGYQTP
jgi:uncharacterized protein (TIGR02588 family)